MSSTDNSDWGMTTPAYYCMDNLGGEKPQTVGMGNVNANLNENENLDGVYDLQGRCVAQPSHGLYIVNGKKYLLK